MASEKKKRSGKAGLPPGALIHVGRKEVEKARIMIIDYDAEHVREAEAASIEECFSFKESPTVTWIDIIGLHDVGIIEKLGGHFGLHPLIQEDILNTAERPKMEDYGEYIFFLFKVAVHGEKSREEKMRQVSLILGPNFVMTFQEKESGVFEPLRDRIRKGKGRLRKGGADYLAYAVIDSIVDGYFGILEKLGDEIEIVESELVSDPKQGILQRIHVLKREMIDLRKSIWPLREVISGLERVESPLIKESTEIFLRDVYDHTIQAIDSVETFRDILSGMLETYLSSVSNRMNEVMKVLTIIATIFIPLTFIAGIYGMNFKFMPELEWRWSYFVILGIMLAAAVVMIIFFRKKKWL